MQRYKYIFSISRLTIFSFIICILGAIFTVKGIINQHNRSNIKSLNNLSEIHEGHYIQYDISLEQLLGKFYTETNGENVYSPICGVNALTNERQYLVAIDEDMNYYIPLIVSNDLYKELEKLITGETKKYHVYGKIKKLSHQLSYDLITDCTGITDTYKIKQMISTKYEIKVIDPEVKESTWYKGLIFLILGILGMSGSIERKKI